MTSADQNDITAPISPQSGSSERPVMLVTGGTGAIGMAVATLAAEAGQAVVIHGSRNASVEAAIDTIKQRVPGAELTGLPADFHDRDSIESIMTRLTARHDRLDSMVHCAITGKPGVTGLFSETNPASYGQHTALVMGCFQQLCFHTLPLLAKTNGSIVALASDAGQFAAPRQSLIGGAFGGLLTFARNLAVEVARDGVRINCVTPTYVENTRAFEQYAAGGRGETARKRAGLGLPLPEDVAQLVFFLCSSGAAKITGQVISINGGLNA